MGRTKYNYLGEVLTSDSMFIPVDDSFFDKEGNPLWRENIQNGDDFGFDLLNKEENEKHIISVVLPSGKKVVRYGEPGGSGTTDEGEQFEGISLPYLKESLPYHEYLVMEDTEVECYVDKGKAAPGFGHKGGAIQYRHYFTIHESIMQGILREDFSWLQKK